MFVIGIDENGLGPRLGMFCVTASVFECRNYDRAKFWDICGNTGVNDSKLVMSSGHLEKGRDIVLLYSKLFSGKTLNTADGFIELMSFSKPRLIKKKCPPHCREMCWGRDFEFPVRAGLENSVKIAKDYMRKNGIKLQTVETIFYCPREFNKGINRYENKLSLEFVILEKFFRKYYNLFDADLLFLCGKLGGTKRYGRFFNYMKNFKLLKKREGSDSSYKFKNFGEIKFIRNGDALHSPIALSSIFGKLVREIFLVKMNRFFRALSPSLPIASGYNDPVTSEFIKRTKRLRTKLKIPDDCFLRIR